MTGLVPHIDVRNYYMASVTLLDHVHKTTSEVVSVLVVVMPTK